MDPNPKSFPILSYVMSRIPKLVPKSPTKSPTKSDSVDFDIEQSRFSSSGSSKSFKYDGQLMVQMPHLKNPELLASMTLAVSDVSQTRSVLQALGQRPDHESVDTAGPKISEIESELSKKLEEIDLEQRPVDVDLTQWRAQQAEKEEECRQAAEKEKNMYKAVIQLDEMHEAYETLLKNAEERLLKIYRSAESIEKGSVVGDASVNEEEAEEEVNEEVVKILKEAWSKGLERVELSGKKLRFLPEAFGKLSGLVSLNLSSNELQVIPDSIAGLQTLEELDLSSNLLESLPDSIGLLLNLRILNVSYNQLKALPDSISHCRSLVELDASYNQLTFLPTKIGHELVNLQKLFIHLNKIRSLPTSICEMKSLRILDAHFNELRGLPNAIGLLMNLEILNLSSNFSDLTELPETFGDLLNLRELDLSNNQISALPDTFGRLDSLTKLNLEHNPLVTPPMEIVNQGVEAVKEFMVKRWLDILLEAERKCILEANTKAQTGGWLTRSTSWLTNAVSVVSENVTGYLGAGGAKPPSYLDQQY